MSDPYLHFFGYSPDHADWKATWSKLRLDVRSICVDAQQHDVDMVVDTSRECITVIVNESNYPTVVLYGPDSEVAQETGRWLVETMLTNRAVWDPWICAVLLRAHQLAPACTAIASDGMWSREWADGVGVEVSDAAPRRIVARLFGGRMLAAAEPDPLLSPGAAFAGPPFPPGLEPR